jgi:CHASE3 domain sensor protein
VYSALCWENIKKFGSTYFPIEDLESSGIFVLGAILCLIISAMLLVKNNEYLANKIAEYAYFLLVVGVLGAFYEYIRDIRKNTGDEHEIC